MTRKSKPPEEPSNVVELKPRRKMTPEQKAKWQASIKANPKNHKPASGKPASGEPASEIPAMGEGWGGPANGPGDPSRIAEARAAPRKTKEERAAQIEEALNFYHAIGSDPAKPDMLRMVAYEKLIDRVEGKAVNRQINADAEGDESWVVERKIIDTAPKIDKKSG